MQLTPVLRYPSAQSLSGSLLPADFQYSTSRGASFCRYAIREPEPEYSFELVDPKIDIVFKRIFGCSEHPRQLLNLINAIMEAFNEPAIEELTVLNPFIDPKHLGDKGAILDIKARTAKGEPLNVEIQIFNQYNWIKRSIYYWSRLFDEQLGKGENYHKLQKTISISLLNYSVFERRRFYSLYELRERLDGQRMGDLLQMYIIEFPKYNKTAIGSGALEDGEGYAVPQRLAEWIQFFSVTSEDDLGRLPKDNPAIQEAAEMLTQMSHDPAERELYEVRRKAFLDYNTNILGAREEGIQTGQRTLLLELGATKFGELPPWVTERVRGASEQQLQAWAKAILAASTLEEWIEERSW